MGTFYEDLTEGLFGAGAGLVEHIPVVGDAAARGLGLTSDETAPAPAPVVTYGPIVTTGLPFVYEVVGPRDAPDSMKEALVFNMIKTSPKKGIAMVLVVAIIIGVLIYMLMKPEKKTKRSRGRRRLA